MKLQTFSVNWKKMTGGCELKGLIYGRHRVLFFLLFLGPNSLAIYSLSPLFFSFLPLPFFLPLYHLKLFRKAISKSPCLYFIGLGQATLACALRCSSEHPADTLPACLPSSGLGALQLPRHHSTLVLINPGTR